MPVIIRCAVKPTPSIYREQDTIDFRTRKDEKLKVNGRHDPAIVHRAAVVVSSVTAAVLCDMLALRFGTDCLGSGSRDPGTDRKTAERDILSKRSFPGSGRGQKGGQA